MDEGYVSVMKKWNRDICKNTTKQKILNLKVFINSKRVDLYGCSGWEKPFVALSVVKLEATLLSHFYLLIHLSLSSCVQRVDPSPAFHKTMQAHLESRIDNLQKLKNTNAEIIMRWNKWAFTM